MVKLKNRNNNNKSYTRFASMGRVSVKIIDQLYAPIDAMNRFLNLALQDVDEGSQARQFLLESKSGLRRMSGLLKRLNSYTKKMQKEFNEITKQ